MRFVNRVVAVWVLGFLLLPGIAYGSRAALDGRGLPRLLAVDPSLVRILPGSAGRFEPGLLLDFSRDPAYARNAFGRVSHKTESDRLGMVIFGESVRYGYLLDGKIHNLILASPGGWGLSLGFADQYSKSETLRSTLGDGLNPDRLSFRRSERSEREVRLGLGWQSENSSSRVFEFGIGVSYLDVTIEGFQRDVVDTVTTDILTEIDSDPGVKLELIVRSISPNPGPQIAATLFYEDLNPVVDVPFDLTPITRGGSFHLGWRLANRHLDDLMIGFTSVWRRGVDATSLSMSSSTVGGTKRTEISGGLFVSAEHNISGNFLARGGVQGIGRFDEVDNRRFFLDVTNGSVLSVSNDLDSAGSILSPEIFLGATWKWKQLVIDVQINEFINLDSPFVRWAAGVKF